jgi:putative Mg2+ transporter-C (MgtC) family protein
MFDLDLNVGAVIARLGLAVLSGAAIGWERQRRGKPVGMRTLMLVGLGSAMFVVAADEAVASAGPENQLGLVLPVVAGLIGGVGFLGAGAIMKTDGRATGVTTAATIWVTAGVGVASGLGEFTLAVICGLATVATLGLTRLAEDRGLLEPGDDKYKAFPFSAAIHKGSNAASRDPAQ